MIAAFPVLALVLSGQLLGPVAPSAGPAVEGRHHHGPAAPAWKVGDTAYLVGDDYAPVLLAGTEVRVLAHSGGDRWAVRAVAGHTHAVPVPAAALARTPPGPVAPPMPSPQAPPSVPDLAATTAAPVPPPVAPSPPPSPPLWWLADASGQGWVHPDPRALAAFVGARNAALAPPPAAPPRLGGVPGRRAGRRTAVFAPPPATTWVWMAPQGSQCASGRCR